MTTKAFQRWLADNAAEPEPTYYPLCPRCEGACELPCGTCEGTGDYMGDESDDDWPYCEDCGGTGKLSCPRCQGRGDLAWLVYLTQIVLDKQALADWNARVSAPAKER